MGTRNSRGACAQRSRPAPSCAMPRSPSSSKLVKLGTMCKQASSQCRRKLHVHILRLDTIASLIDVATGSWTSRLKRQDPGGERASGTLIFLTSSHDVEIPRNNGQTGRGKLKEINRGEGGAEDRSTWLRYGQGVQEADALEKREHHKADEDAGTILRDLRGAEKKF